MKLEDAATEAGLSAADAKVLVDQGLVSPEPADGSFGPWQVAQFSVAKRAKELGVADEQIRGLLSFFSQEAAACAEMAARAESQQADIERQLLELRNAKAQRDQLKGAA